MATSLISNDSAASDFDRDLLTRKLRGLRWSIRFWLLVQGLSRVLLLVVAIALIDLALDWFFRMDLAQRKWLLVIAGGLIAWLCYRYFFRTLLLRLENEALCYEVEKRHPELGQSLISAWQLSQKHLTAPQVADLGVSPELIQATISQGFRQAKDVNFYDTLDTFELRRNLMLLAIGGFTLGGLALGVLWTPTLKIWFQRNVQLQEVTWPQQTYLTVEGVDSQNTLALPRGDDWLQKIDAAGLVPSLVYIDYEYQDGHRATEQLKQVGSRTFHTTFKNMLDEFRFRAYGGDSATPWIHVRLVDRPIIENLTLTVDPPAYTGAGSLVLEEGSGPYPVLQGSRLRIAGTASKPLTRSELKWGDHVRDLVVEGQKFSTSIEAELLAEGAYSLQLVDAEMLASKRPTNFSLMVRADRPPTVRSRLEGISGMIIPGAKLPMALTLQDDFAITAAQLRYRWQHDDHSEQAGAAEVPLKELAEQYGRPQISSQYVFETTPLELAAGMTLSFQVDAFDNDTVSSPDGQNGKSGSSENIVLRVVTEEELRADLLRREKERRVDLERLLQDQERLQTETRAIQATISSNETSPEQRNSLNKVQRQQQNTADRIAAVARQLSQLALEVENNQLEDPSGPIQQRLHRQIIAPLNLIVEESIPVVVQHLDASRRINSDLKIRDQALNDAVIHQERIIRSLREILRHMARSEGYQEAINLLYSVLKSQGEVNDFTVKEAQNRIRDLFGTDPVPTGNN